MDIDTNTFAVTQKFGLFIITCLVISGIAYNTRSASWIDFATKYATRNKAECGNEYLIIDTPTYQAYEIIAESKKIVPFVTRSYQLTHTAFHITLFYISLLLLFDYFSIYNKINTDSLHKNQQQAILAYMILIGVAAIIYPLSSIKMLNKIINDIHTANISDANIINNNKQTFYKLYLPSLMYFIPLIILFILRCTLPESSVDTIKFSKYILYIVFYITILLILFNLDTGIVNLIYQVYNSYSPFITDSNNGLETIIEKLLIDSTGAAVITDPPPPAPYTTYQNKLKHYLMQNIKSHEIVDGDAFILHDYKGKYWKYLLNQNGKEFKDLLIEYPTDTVLNSNINLIRSNMRTLRNNTKIPEVLHTYTKETFKFALFITLVILFAIFHFVYYHMHRPVIATVVVSFIVFLLVILGPIYGWIINVINKT